MVTRFRTKHSIASHCALKTKGLCHLIWAAQSHASVTAIRSILNTAAKTHLLYDSCKSLLFQTKLEPKEVKVSSSLFQKLEKTPSSTFSFTTIPPQPVTAHKPELAQAGVCIPT